MENQNELSAMGVEELSFSEMQETNGGNAVALLIGGAILAGVIKDWKGFKVGFMEA